VSTLDRVMKAYASKHDLNLEQAALVRAELSKFINELKSGGHRPMKFSDSSNRDAGASDQGSIPEKQSATG